MKKEEIKNLILESLSVEANSGEFAKKLEGAGVGYDFSGTFDFKLEAALYGTADMPQGETIFLKNLNQLFYRIALPGVAAIVLLLISIFISEGTISFDSFLGLADSYDESIICLITGI
jgi:hypothetical protein